MFRLTVPSSGPIQNTVQVISGFHRASLLLLVTFITQLIHTIDTVVDVTICAVQKSKRHTLLRG